MADAAVYALGSYRTHVCGDVARVCAEGDVVCVAGWVSHIRKLGGVTFLEIMDRFGVVQCVWDGESSVHRWDVVQVHGKVAKRPQAAVRADKDVVEIRATAVSVVSATAPLPLRPEEGQAHEQTRLKYRYLDLRRPEMWRRLALKSDLYRFTRNFFYDRQFLEIETPVLYKSTPEGARDYLVPSRLYPGHFFALPQSPQMLKQLLMIGGLDRYMQIVKCFRDEDLRQNRQPEFTQLDLECAFVDEQAVMHLLDEYFYALFAHMGMSLGEIRRFSYTEVMSVYGSDAPDLRYEQIRFVPIPAPAVAHIPAFPFHDVLNNGGALVCLPLPSDVVSAMPSRSILTQWEEKVKAAGGKGLAWGITGDSGNIERTNAKAVFTPEFENVLKDKCGKAQVYCILAGGAERFAAMHALRKAVIENLSIASTASFSACWVTGFPLFGYEERLVSMHHPFTAPAGDFGDRLLSGSLSMEALLAIPARAYDLILNGQEVGGGSIRIHTPKLQWHIFELLGLSHTEIDQRFGFFMEALQYGAPPHGGIALGMDRLVAVLDGQDSIRDYIAFPKTQNAQCLMSGAPTPVPEAQLRELGLHPHVTAQVK